ncbi:MAG: sensor histidine kinase [bacterium]|nr:sensor histidine kinase [bacterium]
MKKLKQYFGSIRMHMTLLFTVLVLIALILFLIFSITYTQKSILTNSNEYTKQLVAHVNQDIDSYISYMENISTVVMNDSDVYQYLFSKVLTATEERQLRIRIAEQFHTILSSRTDIYNIGILSDTGKYLINDGRDINVYSQKENMKWYQETMQQNGKLVLSSSHVQDIVSGQYKWVVTLSSTISGGEQSKENGLFFIDLNYYDIDELCESISLGQRGYIYIIDSDGEIVYHPQQQLIISGIKSELIEEILTAESDTLSVDYQGDRKLYTMSRSEKTGWTVVGVSYMSDLMKNEGQIKRSYWGITGILILFAIMLAFFSSRMITQPIKRLQMTMEGAQSGNLVPIEMRASESEIVSLNHSFNRMTTQINQLMKKNIEEQQEKRKSEMKALQAQIKPHFLYNTLDSIIWMIEVGENEKSVEMTAALARFFRQSIGNADEIVSIARELEYTKTYLEIQKMRYQEKMDFVIDVDKEILQEEIVKLVLQPLVENALYHGIKYKEQKGLIRLTGGYDRSTKQEGIEIRVADNGAGMSAETLAHIFEQKEKNESGIGISNIQDRLQLYYGNGYGLSYESTEGEGTTVTIRIPKGGAHA